MLLRCDGGCMEGGGGGMLEGGGKEKAVVVLCSWIFASPHCLSVIQRLRSFLAKSSISSSTSFPPLPFKGAVIYAEERGNSGAFFGVACCAMPEVIC